MTKLIFLVISSVFARQNEVVKPEKPDGKCPEPRELTPFGKAFNAPIHDEKFPTMRYRHLGRSGLLVSVVSYGAWLTFREDTGMVVDKAVEMIETAISKGINFFDNAESYGNYIGESEYIMGLALDKIFSKGHVRRSDLVISTKIFRGGDGINERGLSRKHLIEGMTASLERLQLDYVDVVLCHRPDPFTPMEEVVRSMNYILDQGYAFYWGTSEWSASDVSLAYEVAEKLNLVGPVFDQPLYNIFNRTRVEVEYQPLYDKYNYGLTVYSPLMEGILAGRYLDDDEQEFNSSRAALTPYKRQLSTAPENEKVRMLKPVADKIGCSLSQLALAWCLKNERVSTVLMGASKPEQIEDNVRAVDLFGYPTNSKLQARKTWIKDVIIQKASTESSGAALMHTNKQPDRKNKKRVERRHASPVDVQGFDAATLMQYPQSTAAPKFPELPPEDDSKRNGRNRRNHGNETNYDRPLRSAFRLPCHETKLVFRREERTRLFAS
eukprot:gene695-660_t